ncbi:MAG TPA: GAF and ANTAR domain-containing protein [Catenuloplanes sp.]
MSTAHRPSDDSRHLSPSPLARRLIMLAGTPDDASDIDQQLTGIAQLAAQSLPAVSYASVTAVRDGAPTTVAASSELAVAVDQAQYDEQSGPCLDALHDGIPVPVENIAATMRWPGFREAALRMGLRASVSVPLFAGSGLPVAALNLYGHDADAMNGLGGHVWTVYHTDDPATSATADTGPLDAGGQDLIAGLVEAFGVRALIQQAIGVLMARDHNSAWDAYLSLRIRAAETVTALPEIATSVLAALDRPANDPHR